MANLERITLGLLILALSFDLKDDNKILRGTNRKLRIEALLGEHTGKVAPAKESRQSNEKHIRYVMC